MICTRCQHEPGQPRREHAERVLCDQCAALPPVVEWEHPPDRLSVTRASFEAANFGTYDLNGDGPGFEAPCPVCGRRVTVRPDGIECSEGCAPSRIADELYELSKAAPGFAPPPGQWLDGSPMDPAAEAPEPLPAVPGFPFLHRGAGVVIVGPTGGGRSSLVQACAYDAAGAGVRVAYLGSEVTEGEFNARAADLAGRRGDAIGDELRQKLARVRYLNLASVIAHAWDYPDQWTEQISTRYDVLIGDPLSAVASALDLDFDKSNADFVRFYDRLVQPLVAAGLAVVLLENIGHALEARSRAKGASAKQDRADLTFSCKLRAQPVGLVITAHKIRTVRAPFHRGDSWTFDRETQRIERHDGTEQDGESTWRPTVLMERVSKAVEASPGITRTAIRNTVQGKAQHLGTALDLLIAEGYVEHGNDGHTSRRPFPDPDGERVPPRSPHSSAVPDPFPASEEGPRSPVPLHRDGERGTATLATPEQEARITRLEAAA